MKRSSHNSRAHRILRRAALSVATVGALSIATPLVAGADPITSSPSITAVSATGGDVTVAWSNNDPATSSVTVTLYDDNGDVIATDQVSGSPTTDTLDNVADGGGYSAVVTDTTPAGDVSSDPSTAFDLSGGSYVVDAAPTINDVSATGGDVTVTWSNDAADASSLDVVLYDDNGNVVADDNLPATATTDTFDGVADGGGYTVDVTAHTPSGDLTSDPSTAFDLSGGSYVVDAAPTISDVSATGGDVTVTWSNDAADASSLDVVLYDDNGNVVADDNLPATATTDTFDGVADGIGYTIDVTAHTPGGDLTSDLSASFDLVGGTYSSDAAPTISSVTATGGAITVTWQSNAGDVTGYDVILTDAQGDQIADDALPADATSDTLPSEADGSGYDVQVIAHTPVGDLTADSGFLNLSGGVIAPIPVDPPIVISGGPIVVDPGTVTLTPIDGGTSGWTVSWTEPSGAGSDGYFLVTTDQGDTCSVDATGTVGAENSCTLAPLDGGATDLTGLTVTYYPFQLMEFGATNGGATPVFLEDAVASDARHGTAAVVAERDARHVPHTHTVALAHVTPATSTPRRAVALAGGAVVVLGGGLALSLRRRRVL